MDKNCIKNKGFLIKLMKDAKKITVNTINGQKIKYCLKAKIMLENDRNKKEIYVCFTKINDLSGYKIILHPDVMGVENVKNLETENKTAS